MDDPKKRSLGTTKSESNVFFSQSKSLKMDPNPYPDNPTNTIDTIDNSSSSFDRELFTSKFRLKINQRLKKANTFNNQMKQEAEKKALQEAEFKLTYAKSHILTKISKPKSNKTMNQHDLCDKKRVNNEKAYLNKMIIGDNKSKINGMIKSEDSYNIKPYKDE